MVRGSPATSTLAWSVLLWSSLSLGGVDDTSKGRVEVLVVAGDGFVDVGTGEGCSGFEEGMDGDVVGTDGEMLVEVSVLDEGCCGIVAFATAVVTFVLVGVVEGFVVVAVVNVVVVGLDVLISGGVVDVRLDVFAGVVEMFAVEITPVISSDPLVCFDGVVCSLVATIVVDVLCETGGFVGAEVLEICCLSFAEKPF